MAEEMTTRQMARKAVEREPWIVFDELEQVYKLRKAENLPHMQFWIKEFELWAVKFAEGLADLEAEFLKAEEEKLAAMSDADRKEYLESKIQW